MWESMYIRICNKRHRLPMKHVQDRQAPPRPTAKVQTACFSPTFHSIRRSTKVVVCHSGCSWLWILGWAWVTGQQESVVESKHVQIL